MTAKDSQSRTDTVANSLRRELDETIENLINCARSFTPQNSGEAILHFEWFVRFCLETHLTPILLATASAICQVESGRQTGPSASHAQSIERLRALVARVQTQPLLEMDSEFELYMHAKYGELLPAAQASSSVELSRENLATRRFDDRLSELNS